MRSAIIQQLESYEQYLKQERRLSPHTLEAYIRDISTFLNAIAQEEIQSAADVRSYHVNQYLYQLKRDGRAASSISRIAASLRSFFHFFIIEGTMSQDPTLQIERPKAEAKTPHILSLQETERLLSMPDGESVQGLRDRAMLETLYATGVRVSELMALDLEDVQPKLGFLRCVSSGKERVIPLGQVAGEAIQLYLEKARPEMIGANSTSETAIESALFLNVRGQRMSRQGFWKMIKKYADKLDLPFPITPHTMRHSFAVHLLSNGADVRSVQEMLGHSELATTQRYVEHMKKSSMKDVYTLAHPRAKK
ncbi:tyrosine recombinase [Paenibacillus sp. OSY-SE]|uniref:tyrosine recombinase n=1 Tax=Paenibacillus sp. OSY-SE TaxID=1196323 RepID=UPI00030F6F7F|nr:tyrosine recombinase [Paenibacillus sp. OSY-SE]